MPDLSITEVHALIELADAAIREADVLTADTVDVDDVPDLTRLVLEVLDWSRTAYTDNPLGVQPALLSKFVKMRGHVRKGEARALADRIKSYLKSQDQRTEDDGIYSIDEPLPDLAFNELNEELEDEEDEISTATSTSQHIVAFDEWVLTPQRSDIKQKIAHVALLLESIVQQVQGTNAPDDEQALTTIEKAQLIAILETTLAILRTPLVEKGLLKKASEVLNKGASSAAEKSVQDGLRSMMTEACETILELVKQIF